MNTRPAPEHGTWQRYTHKRHPCHLECCRRAWRLHRKLYDVAVSRGEVERQGRIDITPTREHIAYLTSLGLSHKVIAKTARINTRTVNEIATGERATVIPRTAARILAMRFDPAAMKPLELVSGVGTRRRLQSLVACGWTLAALGREAGCSGNNINQIIRGMYGDRVKVSTWLQVRDLFDRLWNVEPPSASAAQRAAARHAREVAQSRGWVGPLAWDDDSIDDPAAEPVDVKRPGRRSMADAVDELADLLDVVDPDITAEHAARRLGYAEASNLYTTLERAGRHDLRERLDRNAEPPPLITSADLYPSRKTNRGAAA